jgi:hypothetical protein
LGGGRQSRQKKKTAAKSGRKKGREEIAALPRKKDFLVEILLF